jgi:DNA oxidative demethylase
MLPESGPLDLFEDADQDRVLGPGAVVLSRFANAAGPALLEGLGRLVGVAPFRNMTTPGGWRMSVSMTNCGDAGWVTDRTGYRYDAVDPDTGHR